MPHNITFYLYISYKSDSDIYEFYSIALTDGLKYHLLFLSKFKLSIPTIDFNLSFCHYQ